MLVYGAVRLSLIMSLAAVLSAAWARTGFVQVHAKPGHHQTGTEGIRLRVECAVADEVADLLWVVSGVVVAEAADGHVRTVWW